MNVLELTGVQAVLNQLARERKMARASLATIERMREWQFELRCYSELFLRFMRAKSQGDFLTANHLALVLNECLPRFNSHEG